MRCKNCSNEAKSNLKHLGPLCPNCFSRLIEKRIRRFIRVNELFKKDDDIAVYDELEYFLINNILKGMPINLVLAGSTRYSSKSDKTQKLDTYKGYKIVMPKTMDDINNDFLERVLFNKKPEDRLKKTKNRVNMSDTISVLSPISDDEALFFARFNGLKFIPNKKNEHIQKTMAQLLKKHSELRFSLLKSMDKIKKIQEN